MAQYHCAEFIMKKFTEQLAAPLIRQMSPVSHNPAFQRIRVYARFEHMNIMICLQQQSIKSLQLLHNLIIIISQIGIIAKVCTYLADNGVNVLDISQTIVSGFFNMMMIVDMADAKKHFAEISGEMDALGEKIGVSIKCQREEIFEKMHRI